MRADSGFEKQNASFNKATTQLHKVLQQDEFRKATEASWAKHSSEVQSLDVLTRCKKLNEFLTQGLLGESVENNLEALQSPAARPVAVQQALAQNGLSQQHSKPVQRNSVNRRGQARQSNTAPCCPSRQPLTSRITAKETVVLLELLQGEDLQQPACCDDRCCLPCSLTVSITSTVVPPAMAADHADVAIAAPGPTGAAVVDSSLEDEVDIICLLNQPTGGAGMAGEEGTAEPAKNDWKTVVAWLHRQEEEQAALCLQCAIRRQKAYRQLQAMRQPQQQSQQQLLYQQVEQQHVFQVLDSQAPICQGRRSGINLAWEGYFKYWGVHAACVIQRYWRCYTATRRYRRLQQAASVLQAHIRGWHCRQSSDNPLPARRQLLLLRSNQQQQQERDRQQWQAAAVVLQCFIRGCQARRRFRSLLEAAHRVVSDARTAAAGFAGFKPSTSQLTSAPVVTEQEAVQDWPGTAVPTDRPEAAEVTSPGDQNPTDTGGSPSQQSNTSACGPGFSRSCSNSGHTDQQLQSPSGQATYAHTKLRDRHPAAFDSHSPCANSWMCEADIKQTTTHMQAQKPQYHGHDQTTANAAGSSLGARGDLISSSSGARTNAGDLMSRQLVIRSTADTRTAMQHDDNETGGGRACDSGLTYNWMQRAAELSLGEDLQQADLSVRATMAASSFRRLQEAMGAVKTKGEWQQ